MRLGQVAAVVIVVVCVVGILLLGASSGIASKSESSHLLKNGVDLRESQEAPPAGDATLIPLVTGSPGKGQLTYSTSVAQRFSNAPKPTNENTSLMSKIELPAPPSVCSPADYSELGALPKSVAFEQVYVAAVGDVPLPGIESALLEIYQKLKDRVTLIAVDGTLLNLLRWGTIVNDNDADLGFAVNGISEKNTSAHYWAMQELLAEVGIISPVTDRERKTLYNRHKFTKKGKCKYRGKMMQCRHKDSGVIYDLFGPDSLFHPTLSPFRGVQDIHPIRNCRCGRGEFPCPRDPVGVLTNLTLDLQSLPGGPAIGWYEFLGCSLYTRKKKEYTKAHLQSIDESVRRLDRCGYPSLLSDWSNDDCARIRRGEAPRHTGH